MKSLNNKESLKESLTGYLFIFPVYAFFLVFILIPIVMTFFLGFSEYDLLSAPKFVGLKHFLNLFTDKRLVTVLGNTLFFTVVDVGLLTIFGLLIAVLIHQNMPDWLRRIFRTVYFFPVLISMASAALIWQFLYQRDTGVINYYLKFFGISPTNWLGSQTWALLSIIMVDFWKNLGFTMLLFLAGLQNIGDEYYEAAKVDGASGTWMFFRITLPLISPTTLFVVSISLINAFKIFDPMKILTNGGPGDASRSLVLYVYDKGFASLEMGYASALSVLLFAIIMIVTIMQFTLSKRWVHYQ